HDLGDVELRSLVARGDQGPDDVLHVQDSDDVLRVLAPERNSRMAAGEGGLDDLPGGKVRVQHLHRAAVNHDVRDIDHRQVQDAAQRAPVAAVHEAFGVVVFHRATDLPMGGENVDLHAHLHPETAQGP